MLIFCILQFSMHNEYLEGLNVQVQEHKVRKIQQNNEKSYDRKLVDERMQEYKKLKNLHKKYQIEKRDKIKQMVEEDVAQTRMYKKAKIK